METQNIQPYIEPARAIDGWMSDPELYWLATQALQVNTIVEVGCYKGRSTRCLADHCKGTVYAVDPWSGVYYNNDNHPIFESNESTYRKFVENMATKTNVIVCRGGLGDFVNLLPPADMVFIDGDHRYRNVVEDITNAMSVLKPGGLLCGHDYKMKEWPGVEQAVNEVLVDGYEVYHTIWFKRIP